MYGLSPVPVYTVQCTVYIQGDQLKMVVFHGTLKKVPSPVYATAYTCKLDKSLFLRYHKTRPCLTDHPVPDWIASDAEVPPPQIVLVHHHDVRRLLLLSDRVDSVFFFPDILYLFHVFIIYFFFIHFTKKKYGFL